MGLVYLLSLDDKVNAILKQFGLAFYDVDGNIAGGEKTRGQLIRRSNKFGFGI